MNHGRTMSLIYTATLLVACCANGVRADGEEARTQDITFDDIKFDMEKGAPFKRSMLTEKIEKLSDSPIKIRGYIHPSVFQQKGIKQFVLVRDNMECCFGPGAALYDCILVEMAPDKSASFTVRPVSVEGKFEISEFLGPDGKHWAIYRMVGEEVK
ncbi:MAG TPA: DUF3299 domain-containing protein [Pirellulaceae bacterium]|nr:DUF3299 domain-containing protein [Pirellulaceae bacterium]